MNYACETYVEFLSPGLLFANGSAKKVKTRDVSKLKVPKNVFGFRFFDILSVVVDADGKKVELTSGRINVSPMHYYGGKLYTIAQIKRKFPRDDTLISNLRSYGCKKAIHCRTGNWQPFEKADVLIKIA